MICPFCNTLVPDDSVVCPACRADLSMTGSFAPLEGTYCPACGALVPDGSASCPSCGTPVVARPAASQPPAWAEDLPEVEEGHGAPSDETTVIPRIMSAISAEGERREDVIAAQAVPRPFPLFLVAILALLVVGGSVLAVTHPWNTEAYDQRATTERDTSHAGFPGFIETLSGQDSTPSDTQEVISGDEATYEQLHSIYARLGELADSVDDNVRTFNQVATSGSRDERQAGRDDAYAIAIEASNLLAELEQVDVSSGTYEEAASNISTLGNWLRNRADTLTSAWDVSLAYDNPSEASGEIMAALAVDDNSLGRNAYMSLFHDRYAGWEPQPPVE
ncbi:MAG: zinc ribbon domain-containing protein [Atopobiaceae bacterium]|nr:zinc ribbon domain-containing protein [Atopobiaceae bacterium]MBQ3282670.1 zinc ribbon domain-containing protein [Atopobiaceae bacterium]MBR3384882.1 zinc ribbon domain-containing protein [Atopobiaceae bacterium]